MRIVDIIQKKRDSFPLSNEEITYLLTRYNKGEVPDYQISAFCMAVYFKGMSDEELLTFTRCMKDSGEQISFEGIDKFLIDKHSTGGVGDKTTLALAPVLAACDIGTAKLSGRGLGHTGGTIDKFESIPGFTFPESRETMIELVNRTGIGIMGYSDTIVPLDKKLYSLRDVTATVPSIPLIASSIMSKKLAVQSDGIILDVKCGSGAFMKDYSRARELAETMLSIGKGMGRNIIAILSNMDQPLGRAVGNSLEVMEALDTLKGEGPEDFTLLIETIAAQALVLHKSVSTFDEGKDKIRSIISSGEALDYFTMFIRACGGDTAIVEDYSRLPLGEHVHELGSPHSGYIHSIDAETIGTAAMVLGAGRSQKDEEINHGVGIILNKKIGDMVTMGESLCEIYYDDSSSLNQAKERILSSIVIEDGICEKQPVILDMLE